MKTYFTLSILVALAMPLAAAAAEPLVTGKWVYEKQVGDADGKSYAHRTELTLKQDGQTVTGSVVQTSEAPWMREITGRSIEITDGKIDGEKLSFRIQIETSRNQRVSVYDGVVEGDHFKGTLKFRGIGISEKFDAKRAQ